MTSFNAYTPVKLAFLAVEQTDLNLLWSLAIVSFSLIMYNLFKPGACKKIT
jgi:hypothetical protein